MTMYMCDCCELDIDDDLDFIETCENCGYLYCGDCMNIMNELIMVGNPKPNILYIIDHFKIEIPQLLCSGCSDNLFENILDKAIKMSEKKFLLCVRELYEDSNKFYYFLKSFVFEPIIPKYLNTKDPRLLKIKKDSLATFLIK